MIEDNGDGFAVDKESGELRVCGDIKCSRCAFNGGHYANKILCWLMAEHKEPPTLTQKDFYLVQLLSDGWVARDMGKTLHWYRDKPIKLDTYWAATQAEPIDYGERLRFLEPILAFIRWEDEEPWSVEDLRKLKVREEAQQDGGV